MSASALVLDMIRAHYRDDAQAFRAFALRLARMTKSEPTRKTMLSVIETGSRHAHRADPNSAAGRQAQPQKAPVSPFLESLPVTSLDDLLLEDWLREKLDELVLEIAHTAELAERKLHPRCRLLFSGEPGNGKTSAAAGIANELDVPAFGVSIPELVSKYIGETGGNLHKLFGQIRPGCVVVFDELDAIGSSRMRPDQAAAAEHNSVVNSLLTLLDRRDGGTLIATTNRTDVIDPALLRRFDEVIHFPSPSAAQQSVLARRLEEKFGIGPVDLVGCENFDAVTKRVTNEARRLVMREILAAKAAESEEIEDDAEDALE